ncbi:NAD-dependent epimerase/dehydratase family protein [Treponema socranskii]|uniref:NAD-dependent epimerase/dehydratase family protein n=1 Tax=Treponema socranskii TaxID=53419 RepID=UPI003D9343E4
MIGILGQNSYICNRFIQYISDTDLNVEKIDCRNNAWKYVDFSDFETLLCPIGIAHVLTDPSMETQYYAVNRDLPVEIAKKAKLEGVKQFIFFSSMIIYGLDKPLYDEYVITANTIPEPENFYGKSKLEAEKLLLDLEDEKFKITILRLPMVYGPGCKGNFQQLLKVAKKSPFCPSIQNKRSMIYIDNLCEYLKLVIENKLSGILYPQNLEYVSTVEIIKTAAKEFNHKLHFIKIFNPLIFILSKHMGIINKIFGTKIYDVSLSPNMEKYNKVDFEISIKECVKVFK